MSAGRPVLVPSCSDPFSTLIITMVSCTWVDEYGGPEVPITQKKKTLDEKTY